MPSGPVRPPPALTKCLGGTSFVPFRGHLSRPACSHVKQFAKQAGDRVDPGRTYVQAGFFYGLISVREGLLREVGGRNDKRSVDSQCLGAYRGARARGGPSEFAGGRGRRRSTV